MQPEFFSTGEATTSNYQVLARKYRPTTFKNMIGQEVLVKTLANAFKINRIAHAFILTGIRGVGKTTTARIIAKSLNCIGADGNGNATVEPCGICSNCKSISDGCNQDVYEFDAASHTGVNDIREIIENVRYKPVSARYKVYIIDEVHMLSNSAFNALLKTLEEPPIHVKFIFATTEIRKIPATILSRCQRFDLKRVSINDLSEHFKSILTNEGYTADEDALKLVAKISGGSVRDGLSILDQALAHSESKSVTIDQIRIMLGLAGNKKIHSLFSSLVNGNIHETLNISVNLYKSGADPVLILQDLLSLCYNITVRKITNVVNINLTEDENAACAQNAVTLDIPSLSRIWQMLQKGLEEVKQSQIPYETFDMVLIRISYASTLPSVENIVKHLKSNAAKDNTDSEQPSNLSKALTKSFIMSDSASASYSAEMPFTEAEKLVNSKLLKTFDEVIKAAYDADEMMIYHLLRSNVQFISIENNTLALSLSLDTPKNFLQLLQSFLREYTKEPWVVVATGTGKINTVREQEKVKENDYLESLKQHESVQAMLKTFTEIEIVDIKNKQII